MSTTPTPGPDGLSGTQPELRKHHPLGPSSLQNVEACACYQGRQDVVHERTTAGTRAHAVTETGEDDRRLSDEDAAAAAECVDFFEARRENMERDRAHAIKELIESGVPEAEAATQVPPIVELTESKVRVDDCELEIPVFLPKENKWATETVTGTTSGYFDRALIDHTGRGAELFDWKFGMWPVESADNNVQGICYALGLMRQFPGLQRVRVWFKQPLIDYVTSHTFQRNEIPTLMLRVKTIVARAVAARRLMMLDNDFTFARPSTPTCSFCVHIGRCPEVCKFACKVGHKFYPLEIPEDITPSVALDPKNSSVAMRLAGVVKTWAESFRRQVTDRVLRGDAPLPEGFALQRRDGDREVADVDKFRETALQYVSEEELKAATRFTLGDVEEAISAKAARGQKEAAVKAFKSAVEQNKSVVRGEPYSFLRATAAAKETKTENKKGQTV